MFWLKFWLKVIIKILFVVLKLWLQYRATVPLIPISGIQQICSRRLLKYLRKTMQYLYIRNFGYIKELKTCRQKKNCSLSNFLIFVTMLSKDVCCRDISYIASICGEMVYFTHYRMRIEFSFETRRMKHASIHSSEYINNRGTDIFSVRSCLKINLINILIKISDDKLVQFDAWKHVLRFVVSGARACGNIVC